MNQGKTIFSSESYRRSVGNSRNSVVPSSKCFYGNFTFFSLIFSGEQKNRLSRAVFKTIHPLATTTVKLIEQTFGKSVEKNEDRTGKCFIQDKY